MPVLPTLSLEFVLQTPAGLRHFYTMSTENGLIVLNSDTAKHKMAIALTQQQLIMQNLSDEAATIILNEDNLETMAAFLKKVKTAEKAVEEEHERIKKPYWDSGKACDTAKKDLMGNLSAISSPVAVAYKRICDEIAERKRQNELRAEKEKQIKLGVESNIMEFSTKIAACNTRQQLTDIERLINLEKSPSRSQKYGDLHEFAIKMYDERLLPLLKDQKVKIDEKEALENKLKAETDPSKYDELISQLELKQNEITQNQVKVQEQALSQPLATTQVAEEIFPEVKQSGGNMLCEIVDEKKVFTKHRELLNVELRIKDAQKLAYTLRDAGAFGENKELVIDGLKFTIEKRWKV